MHNLAVNFGKEFTNDHGNIPRCGVVPSFSDLEVIALSLTAEALSIDSLLFSKLNSDYKTNFPTLISRRQYNNRRKYLFSLIEKIRKQIEEDIFCIDSKPVEVCRPSRAKRNQVVKTNYEYAPSKGYCA